MTVASVVGTSVSIDFTGRGAARRAAPRTIAHAVGSGMPDGGGGEVGGDPGEPGDPGADGIGCVGGAGSIGGIGGGGPCTQQTGSSGAGCDGVTGGVRPGAGVAGNGLNPGSLI